MAAIAFVAVVATRMYAAGVLLYGQRPGFRAFVAAARARPERRPAYVASSSGNRLIRASTGAAAGPAASSGDLAGAVGAPAGPASPR